MGDLLRSLIVSAVFLFPISSFSATPLTYKVSATLSHGGKEFAAPLAVVRTGQLASIEVTGHDGFKLKLTVTDLAPDRIRVVANLSSAHGSMDPTIVVRPDKPATVSIGEMQMGLTVSRVGG